MADTVYGEWVRGGGAGVTMHACTVGTVGYGTMGLWHGAVRGPGLSSAYSGWVGSWELGAGYRLAG